MARWWATQLRGCHALVGAQLKNSTKYHNPTTPTDPTTPTEQSQPGRPMRPISRYGAAYPSSRKYSQRRPATGCLPQSDNKPWVQAACQGALPTEIHCSTATPQICDTLFCDIGGFGHAFGRDVRPDLTAHSNSAQYYDICVVIRFIDTLRIMRVGTGQCSLVRTVADCCSPQ